MATSTSRAGRSSTSDPTATSEPELWALRYPDHHRLFSLRRAEGGHRWQEPLRARSELLEIQSPKLGTNPAVVIASEPMDDHPDRRLMLSGELLHIAPDLSVTSTLVLPDPQRLLGIDPLPYVP